MPPLPALPDHLLLSSEHYQSSLASPALATHFSRSLDLPGLAELASNVSQALSHLHAHKVVHGNLHLANVMIPPWSRLCHPAGPAAAGPARPLDAKLADHGLHFLSDAGRGVNFVLGHPLYHAPERVLALAAAPTALASAAAAAGGAGGGVAQRFMASAAQDVWALGVILLQLLRGPVFVAPDRDNTSSSSSAGASASSAGQQQQQQQLAGSLQQLTDADVSTALLAQAAAYAASVASSSSASNSSSSHSNNRADSSVASAGDAVSACGFVPAPAPAKSLLELSLRPCAASSSASASASVSASSASVDSLCASDSNSSSSSSKSLLSLAATLALERIASSATAGTANGSKTAGAPRAAELSSDVVSALLGAGSPLDGVSASAVSPLHLSFTSFLDPTVGTGAWQAAYAPFTSYRSTADGPASADAAGVVTPWSLCVDFIRVCLSPSPALRPTARDLLSHPFLRAFPQGTYTAVSAVTAATSSATSSSSAISSSSSSRAVRTEYVGSTLRKTVVFSVPAQSKPIAKPLAAAPATASGEQQWQLTLLLPQSSHSRFAPPPRLAPISAKPAPVPVAQAIADVALAAIVPASAEATAAAGGTTLLASAATLGLPPPPPLPLPHSVAALSPDFASGGRLGAWSYSELYELWLNHSRSLSTSTSGSGAKHARGGGSSSGGGGGGGAGAGLSVGATGGAMGGAMSPERLASELVRVCGLRVVPAVFTLPPLVPLGVRSAKKELFSDAFDHHHHGGASSGSSSTGAGAGVLASASTISAAAAAARRGQSSVASAARALAAAQAASSASASDAITTVAALERALAAAQRSVLSSEAFVTVRLDEIWAVIVQETRLFCASPALVLHALARLPLPAPAAAAATTTAMTVKAGGAEGETRTAATWLAPGAVFPRSATAATSLPSLFISSAPPALRDISRRVAALFTALSADATALPALTATPAAATATALTVRGGSSDKNAALTPAAAAAAAAAAATTSGASAQAAINAASAAASSVAATVSAAGGADGSGSGSASVSPLRQAIRTVLCTAYLQALEPASRPLVRLVARSSSYATAAAAVAVAPFAYLARCSLARAAPPPASFASALSQPLASACVTAAQRRRSWLSLLSLHPEHARAAFALLQSNDLARTLALEHAPAVDPATGAVLPSSSPASLCANAAAAALYGAESATDALIEKDLVRCHQYHPLLASARGRGFLRRVVKRVLAAHGAATAPAPGTVVLALHSGADSVPSNSNISGATRGGRRSAAAAAPVAAVSLPMVGIPTALTAISLATISSSALAPASASAAAASGAAAASPSPLHTLHAALQASVVHATALSAAHRSNTAVRAHMASHLSSKRALSASASAAAAVAAAAAAATATSGAAGDGVLSSAAVTAALAADPAAAELAAYTLGMTEARAVVATLAAVVPGEGLLPHSALPLAGCEITVAVPQQPQQSPQADGGSAAPLLLDVAVLSDSASAAAARAGGSGDAGARADAGGRDFSSAAYSMPYCYHGDVYQAAALLYGDADDLEQGGGGGGAAGADHLACADTNPLKTSPQMPLPADLTADAAASAASAGSSGSASSETAVGSAGAALTVASGVTVRHVALPPPPPLVYWQGMDSVCAVAMLLYWPREDFVLAVTSRIISKYLRGIYVPDNGKTVAKLLTLFSQLLTFHDPELAVHLHRSMYTPDIFALPWFFTLFSHSLSLEKTHALWDVLLLHPPEILVHFAVALLTSLRLPLLASDVGGCAVTLSKAMATLDVPATAQAAVRSLYGTPTAFYLASPWVHSLDEAVTAQASAAAAAKKVAFPDSVSNAESALVLAGGNGGSKDDDGDGASAGTGGGALAAYRRSGLAVAQLSAAHLFSLVRGAKTVAAVLQKALFEAECADADAAVAAEAARTGLLPTAEAAAAAAAKRKRDAGETGFGPARQNYSSLLVVDCTMQQTLATSQLFPLMTAHPELVGSWAPSSSSSGSGGAGGSAGATGSASFASAHTGVAGSPGFAAASGLLSGSVASSGGSELPPPSRLGLVVTFSPARHLATKRAHAQIRHMQSQGHVVDPAAVLAQAVADSAAAGVPVAADDAVAAVLSQLPSLADCPPPTVVPTVFTAAAAAAGGAVAVAGGAAVGADGAGASGFSSAPTTAGATAMDPTFWFSTHNHPTVIIVGQDRKSALQIARKLISRRVRRVCVVGDDSPALALSTLLAAETATRARVRAQVAAEQQQKVMREKAAHASYRQSLGLPAVPEPAKPRGANAAAAAPPGSRTAAAAAAAAAASGGGNANAKPVLAVASSVVSSHRPAPANNASAAGAAASAAASSAPQSTVMASLAGLSPTSPHAPPPAGDADASAGANSGAAKAGARGGVRNGVVEHNKDGSLDEMFLVSASSTSNTASAKPAAASTKPAAPAAATASPAIAAAESKKPSTEAAATASAAAFAAAAPSGAGSTAADSATAAPAATGAEQGPEQPPGAAAAGSQSGLGSYLSSWWGGGKRPDASTAGAAAPAAAAAPGATTAAAAAAPVTAAPAAMQVAAGTLNPEGSGEVAPEEPLPLPFVMPSEFWVNVGHYRDTTVALKNGEEPYRMTRVRVSSAMTVKEFAAFKELRLSEFGVMTPLVWGCRMHDPDGATRVHLDMKLNRTLSLRQAIKAELAPSIGALIETLVNKGHLNGKVGYEGPEFYFVCRYMDVSKFGY